MKAKWIRNNAKYTTAVIRRVTKGLFIGIVSYALAGCGVLAAPCRITSAAIKMIPVVGHAAALPTDTCAAVIDP